MMTISTDLIHNSCSSNIQQFFKHSQVHAYYGHLSTIPTHTFLKKHGRPFIISRSNSVGSGAYAGHWTGDNVANWDFLRLSISGNFLFQIFGIHMVGADICGFRGNTNQELCARWNQVGSMYPFARNHNQNQSISQEPFRFGKMLQETAQLSLMQRYSLLKQMYSTMVSLDGKGSFYRPIIFQFPFDEQAYQTQFVETQFMIGDYLLSAPIVMKAQSQRQVYFPGKSHNQLWYQLTFNINNGFTDGQYIAYKSQETYVIRNRLPSALPIFLRSGRMIFTNQPKTRTGYLDSNFTIIAGLDSKQSATGYILGVPDYNDDRQITGVIQKGCKIIATLSQISQSNNNQYRYRFKWIIQGKFRSSLSEKIRISRIIIYGHEKVLRSNRQEAVIIDKDQGIFQFLVSE